MYDQMSGLGAALMPLDGSKAYAWDEVIDFDANILTLLSGQKSQPIDNTYGFVAFELSAEVWITAASGNVATGYPAAEAAGSGNAANVNSWMTRAHHRLQITVNGVPFFRSPQRVSLCAGTVKIPAYLRPRRIINPGSTIIVDWYNDSAESVRPQVVLKGVRHVPGYVVA